MTPARQKWWDSLPQEEKELREAIAERQKWIKIEKSYLPDSTADIKHTKYLLRRQKIMLKALKHELERGGKCGVVYRQVNCLLVPTCDDCGAIIPIDSYKKARYCPHCGKKIKQ